MTPTAPPILVPALYALFVWWFTTGAIVAMYGLPRRALQGCFAAMTALLLVALAGLAASREDGSARGVFVAFSCATVAWGWLLASYYLGFITGPKGGDVANGAGEASAWRRLRGALRASVYHEALAVAFLALLAWLLADSPNRWGLWTWLTLWAMHASSKLNVFCGVRNFHIEFLPAHLHFLDRFLAKKPISPFFPLSVFVASAIALTLWARAFAPGVSAGDATGLVLVGTMMGLGILEHWLLVLPLPATLWGWRLRTLPRRAALVPERVAE